MNIFVIEPSARINLPAQLVVTIRPGRPRCCRPCHDVLPGDDANGAGADVPHDPRTGIELGDILDASFKKGAGSEGTEPANSWRRLNSRSFSVTESHSFT